ncbi:MAG: SPOR domain-containing protein [Bacteroidota bacterium]
MRITELNRYLAEALHRNEVVSVAEIGSIRLAYQAARINSDGKTIHPPKKSIFFSQTVDSGALIERYLIEEQLFHPESAREASRVYQEHLLRELHQHGYVSIGQLGTLRRNAEQELTFQSAENESNDLNDAFFGLQPLAIKQAKRSSEKPVVIQTPMKNETNAKKSGFLRFLGWKMTLLLVVLVAAGAALFAFNQWDKAQQSQTIVVKTETESAFPSYTQTDSSTPEATEVVEAGTSTDLPVSQSQASSEQAVPQKISVKKAPPANARVAATNPSQKTRSTDSTEPTSDQPEEYQNWVDISVLDTGSEAPVQVSRGGDIAMPDIDNGKYHLIAGSFYRLDQAEQFVRQMQSEGFTPTILKGDSLRDRHRVSIFRSDSRKDVESYATKLRRLGREPGWIYEDYPND